MSKHGLPPALFKDSPDLDRGKDSDSSGDESEIYPSNITLKSPETTETTNSKDNNGSPYLNERDDEPDKVIHSPITSPGRPSLRRLGRMVKNVSDRNLSSSPKDLINDSIFSAIRRRSASTESAPTAQIIVKSGQLKKRTFWSQWKEASFSVNGMGIMNEYSDGMVRHFTSLFA